MGWTAPCALARNVKVRIQDLQVGNMELLHTTRIFTCWDSNAFDESK